MNKNLKQLLVILTLMLGAVAAFVPVILWTARASASESAVTDAPGLTPACPQKAPVLVAVNNSALPAVKTLGVPQPKLAMSAPAPSESAVLNARHRFALGMIETDNNDDEIGGAGEVSRYQIMPSVWRHYSSSADYQDPQVSREVAQEHWTALYAFFKEHARREPTDFDMYVLWNTRYGYYASRGFNPDRLNTVVRDRAQRFANLVERGES